MGVSVRFPKRESRHNGRPRWLRSIIPVMKEPPELLDKWADWLLHRRHGGDSELLRRQLDYLRPVRDRVLENAAVRADDVVLDAGAGDGLIAFGALARLGPSGRVI